MSFAELCIGNNFSIIRLFIVLLIGVSAGYFLSSPENPINEAHKSKGRICLVIDDFGFAHNQLVDGFFSLDANITLAVIPFEPYSKFIGNLADSLGVETIIHMPMESYEKENDQYTVTLHERLNEQLVEEKINAAFSEIPSAVGMNNHQGSKATEDLQLMKYVARSLKKLDKFFLDSFTNPESRGYITMRRYGVPVQLRQIFLDHEESRQAVEANIDSLARLSHIMDIAVGVGHVKQVTLEVLREKIPKLKKEGYEFIPLSKAVR